jgi:peptidoglycan hydrolase CwlO-like protein
MKIMNAVIAALEAVNHFFSSRYQAIIFVAGGIAFAWILTSQMSGLDDRVQRIEVTDLPEIRNDLKELDGRLIRLEVKVDELSEDMKEVKSDLKEIKADIKTLLSKKN